MGEIFVRPVPAVPLPFTGERLTSELTGETEIEHLHRYLHARDLCRAKDVLDVASGEGYGSALLAQVAASVTGVELAADAVAHARKSYRRDNLRFVQSDARNMEIASQSFDVVVSFETIEHFAEQEQFLLEVRRVLRPGGMFIVSTPDRDNYSIAEGSANPYHILELTYEEFAALISKHFEHVRYLVQRPIIGSVMLPSTTGAASKPALSFEKRGEQQFEGSKGLPRPRYVIALASDYAIDEIPPTLYFETSHLGALTAPNDVAVLKQKLEAQKAESASVVKDLKVEMMSKLRQCEQHRLALHEDLAVRDQQQSTLRAELDQSERQLLALRADLTRHDQQKSALRAELASHEQRQALLRSELEQTKRENAALKDSTSWRVTAPLRGLKELGWSARTATPQQLSYARTPDGRTPAASSPRILLRRARSAVRFGRENGLSALMTLTRHKIRPVAATDLAKPPPLQTAQSHRVYAPHQAHASPEPERMHLARDPAPQAFTSFEPRPAPISVVIPTHNRAGLLEETLRCCIDHSGNAELEFVVIDDGSTDDTAAVLKRLETEIPKLLWRSIPNGGPGGARNLGASIARHSVVLFLGDDIRPVDSSFFAVHARLHALNPSDRFAVLGKVVWPRTESVEVNFVMSHIQGQGGEQFGYADLTPYTFLDWRFFYTSNVSVKRAVVSDWLKDGFRAQFKLAAFEDGELAYRLYKQKDSFRIYYDPTSVGRHFHPYTLNGFLNRQMGTGMMAKVFIDLHPEAADALGVAPLLQALATPLRPDQEKSTADYLSMVEGLRAWARVLDTANALGREWWHNELLFAVFEASYLQGCLLMQAENSSNIEAGYQYILTRCLQRMRKSIHHELTGHEFLKARLGLSAAA